MGAACAKCLGSTVSYEQGHVGRASTEKWSMIMAARKAAVRKNAPVPRLWVKKGDSLKTIHAKARRAITPADLQRYTEIEEGIPFVIAEAEAIHREESRNRKQKKTMVKKAREKAKKRFTLSALVLEMMRRVGVEMG